MYTASLCLFPGDLSHYHWLAISYHWPAFRTFCQGHPPHPRSEDRYNHPYRFRRECRIPCCQDCCCASWRSALFLLPFPHRIRKSESVPQSSPVMTALPVSAHNLLHDTDPGSSSHYRRMQAQHTDLQDIYTLRCGNLHMLSVPFRE